MRTAITGLHDCDYSVSVAEPHDDAQLRRLVAAYNGLGGTLRAQRQDLYQRELLLDTVIQASPLALVLTNATGTILYANLAARQLLGAGHKLEGLALAPLLEHVPAALREALEGERDSLFTVELDGDTQVFHVSQRRFLLNGQPHRLRLLKQLTREVNAQEVAVWKKVIRVIAHEINNSVAPIASLAQSGHRLAQHPDDGATAARLRRHRRSHGPPVAVRGRLLALRQAAEPEVGRSRLAPLFRIAAGRCTVHGRRACCPRTRAGSTSPRSSRS